MSGSHWKFIHERSDAELRARDDLMREIDELLAIENDCVGEWLQTNAIVEAMTYLRDRQLLDALEHGHTQTEFARALGISPQAMNDRVKGARRRTPKRLEAQPRRKRR